MERIVEYIASRGEVSGDIEQEVEQLIERHRWFTPARRFRQNLTQQSDPIVELLTAWRRAPLRWGEDRLDVASILVRSEEDIIDTFLRQQDLRIVAQDSNECEDELLTSPTFDDEDDIVSEELAEIYLSQGLYSQAKAIYTKLSLLNTEKSVYFAELISKIEDTK